MQKYWSWLLGVGLVVIAGGLAFYWNSLTRTADAPKVDNASIASPVTPGPAKEKPAQAQQTPATAMPATAKALDVPVFDVLRVEADGSVVIAGQAAPNSAVDVVAGAEVVGQARAGANGDFAVVLDRALSPGDHQLVLRATSSDKHVATSAQTAIVSVPATADGQVLALVEEPGQASRLITKPKTAPEGSAAGAPSGGEMQAGAAGETEQAKPDADRPIAIEAVEIEGSSVFVAGKAKDGARVIVHANDVLLGTSAISPEGRFLVQGERPLAIGDYIIRADLLDGTNRILATARVPFRREAGENMSAVAPAANQQAGSAHTQADGAQDTAALQKVDGSVIIRRGDNLWTISKRTYGEGTRYTTIYLANRDQIRNPDLIWPGQVFVMPKEPLRDNEVKRKLLQKNP
ncbi:LysM peptidoglycan-binding domain-containing protein [Brucella sp. 10RB9213]|uniref:LysM peptidoglycan-binding domain-containing protein n=1 Tax=Brucella sp. 10RB9213 TaxID=1844039 RepID=UPI0012ADB8AF|nr:LysM peptidoglycan-binding domain-containing protein [Brucella sp. 10RB9213]MRN67793.1 LysM peptidoglycan-binding domain-containing protein [Brucella sp. 10RB9213]